MTGGSMVKEIMNPPVTAFSIQSILPPYPTAGTRLKLATLSWNYQANEKLEETLYAKAIFCTKMAALRGFLR